MNEKLFEMLDDRLSRIEAKQDTIIAQHGDHKERLAKIESQIGIAKWLGGTLVTFLIASIGWITKQKS